VRGAALAVLFLVACAAAPESETRAIGNCSAELDAARPQYIIGYGSLMQDESRMRTSPQAGAAHPVDVAGFRRGWFARGSNVGFSTTFLGAVQDASSHFNAVVYAVNASEVVATDKRERSYCRGAVPISSIKVLEPQFVLAPNAQAWIYVSRGPNVSLPNARYPIVQSYVDIFLAGCLEQEERFRAAGFARQCVATTYGWSEHWVNDRIYPRRPFVYQPRARDIDALLSTQLPDYFNRIRIE
jgi:hypothetical protein